MEILNDICYLTVGDKIKLISNNEAGEILNVINKNKATIMFFDKTLDVSSLKIKPFKTIINQNYETVLFYKTQKRKKTINKTSIIKTTLPDEIDLHAEVLLSNHQFMSNEVIVQKQISHLQNYIERAIKSNKKNITIIHGKGNGSLRSQVIELLENKYFLSNFNISDIGKTTVRL